ncbi:hypothetical protein [Faecalicoccus pleomorphus]|uniref:Uncharacterized protein n=1 Tax=Faecalicoccus pleomorphus TaxID=1323 RepID=A0AAW6CTR8_9FIRM|nr:hypothetical protein [Faecalicoccus pleomorphus]MDB7979418.1 hypothetical protein [Faecalicoccus pleomorphus]MDB7981864.1 hypothetical protein [Faecalicoccus pleomorphus]
MSLQEAFLSHPLQTPLEESFVLQGTGTLLSQAVGQKEWNPQRSIWIQSYVPQEETPERENLLKKEWFLISLQIEDLSMPRLSAMNLREELLFKPFSIMIRSERVRCLWLAMMKTS